MSPSRRDFLKATAGSLATIHALRTGAAAQTIAAPAARSVRHRAGDGGAQRRARRGRVVRRRARRPLPPSIDQHARAAGQRRQRQRVVRARRPHAGQRLLGLCGDERDDAAGAQNAAREAAVLSRAARSRAEAPRRARAGDAREGHVDDARAPRSARRAARGEDRAAARRQRSGAQGQGRPVRQLGPRTAARDQDARDVGRHQRHADDRSASARASRRRPSAAATSRATRRSSRRAARAGSTSSRSTCRATPSDGRRSPPRS